MLQRRREMRLTTTLHGGAQLDGLSSTFSVCWSFLFGVGHVDFSLEYTWERIIPVDRLIWGYSLLLARGLRSCMLVFARNIAVG